MDEQGTTADVVEGAGRVAAFSDGVMAVVITILALGLQVPKDASWAALRGELPNLLIYALAFAFIAIYWNNHHHLLRATTRIDGAVMWSNMALLFCLSLVPVATNWLHVDALAPVPVATFGVVALAAALSYGLLVRAIVRANGRDSFVGRAIASDLKGNLSLGLYAAGVVFAVADAVWVAYALYVAVALVWLVPDRRFTRGR